MTQAWDFVTAAVLWQRERGVLAMSVDDIDWGKGRGPRIRYACAQARVRTVSDLLSCSEAELLRNANFGIKSLQAIKEFLKQNNLRLGMDVYET